MSKMKRGVVVHLRLNPEDAMGSIDVLKAAGISTFGMGLGMVARLALSGLLEAARKNEIIPRRDGFEYDQMISPYLNTSQASKLQVAEIVESAENHRVAFDLPATAVDVRLTRQRQPDRPELPLHIVRKKGRILVPIAEGRFKKQNDPLNFTEHDDEKLSRLEEALEQLDSGKDISLDGLV